MGEVLNTIKRHWKVLTILGAFVGICFFLNWVFDNYGPNIALMWLAIFIAAIAAIAALWSLKTTRHSLELTRTTQRPFLNVEGDVTCKIYPKSIGRVIARINNKGVFPADEVSTCCEVRRIKNSNAVDRFSLPFENEKEYYPSYCFPGDHIQYFFEKAGIETEIGDKLEVYITIKYRNKLTKEKYKTIRAYLMTYSPGDRNEILPPYPQGDYWD
ncbi:MAG: hypothetical protein KAW90_07260 [Dehalococcoidales bacterium]|nr:hypothetical protein [Dehalococcoidales bacterium]